MRKALDGWESGFNIGGKKISNLRFADDTTLVATNESDMKLLLSMLRGKVWHSV